jgi:hypothetical protein
MNNNLIGILIVTLYFANYHICELIYPNDIPMFWKLKVAIYCLIILLAFEYKKQNIFLEKLFCAIIFNNIYVLLFNNETHYTLNDIYFIAFFTLTQYIKYFYKLYKQWSNY